MNKDDVKKILYAYPIGSTVSDTDLSELLSMLEKHPRYTEKVGVGVQSISVENGMYGTRCFYIHRIDGTSTDFSYLACFNKPKDDFAKAARRAIEPSIMRFRDTLPKKFECPINGTPLTRRTAHIDHMPPNTFQQIVKKYLANHEIGAVEYDRSGIGVSFVYPNLAASFRAFHDSCAQLRGISKKANLSLPKV